MVAWPFFILFLIIKNTVSDIKYDKSNTDDSKSDFPHACVPPSCHSLYPILAVTMLRYYHINFSVLNKAIL